MITPATAFIPGYHGFRKKKSPTGDVGLGMIILVGRQSANQVSA
ncbi:hypothetical protein SARI_02885 [Salmonella enterica subsp. arizonae serovar 62:z4,z23:-]|uniref:Uncharacterized protein n=1 Tax=Salmonella arizonae (strain ATCC BAA-731 / CDC346-86 / RSK2980) TaxID=41514 RepID=A9MQD4_SALAR|nr:hypothetical protein SARI_02885 [Salmonella enterica subsp. arizonae serovar 62:z4,z23:-]